MRRACRRSLQANSLSIVLLCLWLLPFAWPSAAMAQAFNHPFAVGGGDEGPTGPVSGLTAWLMAQESSFSFMLTHALRESRENHAALLLLAGLSFGYGVVHAAGPGHGKAVITSYLISNEKALRRGLVIALLAALLQGLVAIALVGSAAGIFHVTAQYMNAAAHDIDLAAYAGIVLLGLVLLTTKGAALTRSLRQTWDAPVLRLFASRSHLATAPPMQEAGQAFLADDGSDHVHGPNCGHFHAPDPRQLGEGFSWKSAATTIGTAGARPCAGAILILVFSLAQNIFLVGVAAVFAMALGTALTTGCLATLAVFAKKTALRMSGAASRRAEIVGRVIEVAAAFCVLLFGATLLYATVAGLTPAV